MKMFDLVLSLRLVTKKIIFLRKIIDFIPVLSTFDKFMYRLARVRIEEQKTVSYLLNDSRPIINLVCDLRCTPQTYGDFSEFLMAIRILSSRFEVTFIMVIDHLRSDWKELNYDGRLARISDFRDLADKVLANHGAELKIANSFVELSNLIATNQTLFSDFTYKRKRIYWDLKFLNNRLYRSLGCDSNVLLDKIEFSELSLKPSSKYLLWHIRTESLWGKEQDMSDQEIVEIYESLRRVLGTEIEIIVCGNQQGLQKVTNLAAQHTLDMTSARIYSEDFLGDLTLLRTCEFFLQVSGGGFAEYAWNSSVPYFIASFPWKKSDFKQFGMIQSSKNQIKIWQSANQVFLLNTRKSKDNFENQLRKFWNNLSVVN